VNGRTTLAILLFAAFLNVLGQTTPHTEHRTKPRISTESRLIKAGESVGLLRLEDTREQALKLFPSKPNMDLVEETGLGTTYAWVDQENGKVSRGNVFVHLKGDRVFQIDSATTRFQTLEGITIYATPEQVRKHYKHLRAYVLSNSSSMATGERPLVYWVDSDKGIAFAFAYYPEHRVWYVYHIIVFAPHSEVHPLDEPDDPSEKRELAPYSFKTN
jgi:hypothetical protein